MCDTVVVVQKDRVLFAKNSDRDPNEAQLLDWIPAADHEPDTPLRCTWRVIPQVAHTHAVLLSRPYWMWGAEMGSNEHGVTIGNEAVFTNQPYAEDGLLGMDLVRLGLERARSAEEALQVLSELITRYGQGGRCGYSNAGFRYHNSFLIADGREAYVLEAAGRELAHERVVSGVRAISNGLTLAPLLRNADRLRGLVGQCRPRRQRMEALCRDAAGPASLAAALRDHGDGGSQPLYRRLNGAMGAPCMHYGGLVAGSQTTASWVAELRPDGARHWGTGTAAPCLSLFRPLAVDRPLAVGRPSGTPDEESLWWRFERLHRRLLQDLGQVPAAMLSERDSLEAAAWARPEQLAAHWSAADDWLERWRLRCAAEPQLDARPEWLRRRWQAVEEEAQAGSRLPAW